MPSIHEALSWLNKLEPTHLPRTTQALLRFISSQQRVDYEHAQLIANAIQNSRSHADQLELPEVMLQIARIEYEQQDYLAALDYAQAASHIYPEGSFRSGVTRWICGMSAWKTGQYRQAFAYWYFGRETMQKLAGAHDCPPGSEAVGGIGQVLLCMNVEMVCVAEEIYTWLDAFEPSRLSGAARHLVNGISDHLERKQIQDVYTLVSDLQSLGSAAADPLEYAEILVECAVALYRMDNHEEAEWLLRQAIESFPAQSHQQMVTRWLMGAILWDTPEKHAEALAQWEQCLDGISDLIAESSQNNQPERVLWYRRIRATMSRALDEKVGENIEAL